MVIIAASGMMENGRILHHPRPGSERSAEYDSGSRLSGRAHAGAAGGETAGAADLRRDVPLHARVEVIDGYSAHADRNRDDKLAGQGQDKSPRLGRYGWCMERQRCRTNSRRHSSQGATPSSAPNLTRGAPSNVASTNEARSKSDSCESSNAGKTGGGQGGSTGKTRRSADSTIIDGRSDHRLRCLVVSISAVVMERRDEARQHKR